MPPHGSFLRGSSHFGDGRARRARRARAAQGDILEDIALIENLEETKRTALEIADKVVLAKETGASLSQAREVRGAAARARARSPQACGLERSAGGRCTGRSPRGARCSTSSSTRSTRWTACTTTPWPTLCWR
jgi:hypothetical protein